jgi:hypothetical protein
MGWLCEFGTDLSAWIIKWSWNSWVWNMVSHTRKVQHKLRILGNRVLKRALGPNREEVTRGCRSRIMWSFRVEDSGNTSSETTYSTTRCHSPKTTIHIFSVVKILYLIQTFHDVVSSPSIIRVTKSRRMRWAGSCTINGEMRNSHKVLDGSRGGKRQLESRRRGWEASIKTDLKEKGWVDVG